MHSYASLRTIYKDSTRIAPRKELNLKETCKMYLITVLYVVRS